MTSNNFRIRLIPTTLPHWKYWEELGEWQVTQHFVRLSEPVVLFGYGKNRKSALHHLAVEIYEEEIRDHSDPWQFLWNFLWWVTGLLP